jgi:hypothetical protein
MYDDEQIDVTKLKYVLYARKSTDDPQRQVRSIDDQIDECKLLASRNKELNLHQSVRAKVIFNFMYDMLKNFHVTREDYDQLCKRLNTKNNADLQAVAVKIHSKQGALKNVTADIKERSLKILNLSPSSTIYKTNEAYITEQVAEQERLEGEITALQEQITDPQQDMMSFDEFLNVAKSADLYLRAADIAAKDRITRLIYLNVTVDDQNVVDYQIREPFKTYFQMHKISNGRGDRT